MEEHANPFQFWAANDLSPEKVLEYYVEDFNYSRFIDSTRNLFIRGERGSGKTMTLLYHALATRRCKAKNENRECSLDMVGIYVPCNTPLMHRTEHELLNAFRARVLSEHVLVLGIVHWLAKALDDNSDLIGPVDATTMANYLTDALGRKLPVSESFFRQVLLFARAEIRNTQKAINRADSDTFYENALSFGTLLMPLFEVLQEIDALSDSHFLLMIDDAHDLNEHQIQVLNSWIAYRDHGLFSFKVATVRVDSPPLMTATGGSILEGHDFIVVDMEKPIHNAGSDFGRLASRIVSRRLQRIGYKQTPEDFFPVHASVTAGLNDAEELARQEARAKYPNGTSKQISDYVYKYRRAIYFRRRHKANLPVYSGFKTIVYLSTGVVRNLLEPCYWMYDKAVSANTGRIGTGDALQCISPRVQNEVIVDQSRKAWERIRYGLDKIVVGCGDEDARKIERLFEQLAQLFRARLFDKGAEPRATSFSISGREQEPYGTELDRLLKIARRAALLYDREGSAKDHGSREYYYVPNRILWPVRGLDVQGQHARVQLPAARLLAAAKGEANLKMEDAKEVFSQGEQGELFT